MRKFFLYCSLLLGAGASAQSGSSPEKFFPYQYENYLLGNGFKSILIPIKGSGLVAYYTIVRTGSRDEWEPGKTGFAHFFEHMMFRGTQKHPADQYNLLVSEMGASANAYTTDDLTCYYLVIPGDHLETAMDLESDRFQNLSYGEGPFRTEAGAIYGEYRKNITNPFVVAYERMLDTAFDRHTYKHTTMGFESDIKNMPSLYEFSKSFFQRYYRPENCILLLVGDFNPQQAKSLIEQYYGKWTRGYVPPDITPEPPQEKERKVKVSYNGRTLPLLWIAYKGQAYDPGDKTVVAAYLLVDLAFGENSEIYKKLVIREQKVQFISGDMDLTRDPKLYNIYSRVKEEQDVPYVIEQVNETAEKFKSDLVSEEELENNKKRARYSYLMSLDTPDNVASGLVRIIALTGGVEAVDRFYHTMETLTPQDIREAARQYLQQKRRTVLILKGDQS